MTPISSVIPEQRAVYLAELAFDRAYDRFVASIAPGQGCQDWAARIRYYDAELALQAARARLNYRVNVLAGRRHLHVTCGQVTTKQNGEGTPWPIKTS